MTDDLELIKSKINIVEFISEYLPLKKAGVNFKANCPFHQESTPSFVVSPERNIWHCFGCDRGGDTFKFLMEKEGLEFKEALDILAQKAGVTLRKVQTKEKDGKEKLYEANQKTTQFYHYLLTQHKLGLPALSYLKKRGLTDETIKKFNLGYSPNNWEVLTKFLKKRGFILSELTLSGLCVPSNRGLPAGRQGCYDRFRGRVMIPLIDVRDRVVGFSGRILDKGEQSKTSLADGGPKYINTPQTPIFDKSKFLFGLSFSKGDIKQKNEAVLTEGDLDMIMSYQSGVKNVVASKGTALTEEQVELIKKYTDTISLCFDTDLAGDAAARRGIEIADRAGLNIKVINFDGAKDPAELCLENPKLWEKAVKEAVPIYDYYLDSVQKRFDIKKAEGKRAIFAELLPIWKKITDPITKEHYIEKLAALLQVKEELIRKHIEKLPVIVAKVTQDQKEPPKRDDYFPKDRRTLLEEYLIALLLHLPKDHTYVPNFPETLLQQEELKQIYVLLVIFLDSISFKGRSFKISEFIDTTPQDLSLLIDRLYLMQIDEKLEEEKTVWQKEVDTVVAELKKMLIKSSLEKLSLQIKSAQEFGNIENLEVLNRRFRDLSVKLKNA